MPADSPTITIQIKLSALELLSEVIANDVAATSRQLARGGTSHDTAQLLDRIATLGEIVVAAGTAALLAITTPPTSPTQEP
jgi:hypothetical protein